VARWAATLLAVSLVGCGTSGVQVSPEQASAIQRGVSTEADVRASLGSPTGVSVVNGRRILVYSGSAYSVRPQSFIPIVGAFVGGADVRTSMVMITIGEDGKVSDVQSHHQEQGSATGLAAQPVPQAPQQPR
jgi:outer membrane protein assembly factor BamE (lipoprotein component of BamABCDE complex)